MVRIGEDRTERLDIVPAQLRVIVTVRPKYACRVCEEGVTQGNAVLDMGTQGLEPALRRFAPAKTDGHPEVASAASTPHFFVLSYHYLTADETLKDPGRRFLDA